MEAKSLNSKVNKIIFSLFFAVVLFYGLFKFGNISGIFVLFSRIDWRFAFFAFLLYVAVNGFRALRFYILLGQVMRLKDIFSITLIHNFLVNLLPFRTGEASYVYLTKRAGGVGRGIGTLLLSRFFDVLIIANLFFVSLYFISVDRVSNPVSGAVFIAVFFLVFASFVLLFFASFLFRILSVIFGKFRVFSSLFSHFQAGSAEIESIFSMVRNRNYFFNIFFLSLVIWFLNYWVGGLLLYGLGFDFSFFDIIFIFSLQIIISEISPVQSFANFGLYEWSLVGGLVFLGVMRQEAVSASIVLHAQELLFSFLLGLIGFLMHFYGANVHKNSQ